MSLAQLILASASPRRKELLERIGLNVKVMPASVEESRFEKESPEHYAKRLAREKVLSVAERLQVNINPEDERPLLPKPLGVLRETQTRWVLGADTIVVFDNHILEKPVDTSEAQQMLRLLSNNVHEVITGFCIFDLIKNKEGIQSVSSAVKFKSLSESEIEKYLATGESLDKAGGYAVQGVASYMVEWIRGSYTNIVGLPLCQVVEMLHEMGANELLPF